MVSSSPAQLHPASPLRHRLEELEVRSRARALAVAVYDLETGLEFHYRSDRWFHAASTIKLAVLLGVLFTIHDPTTLNRQGGDVGTQYRSVIFYHSPEQLAAAKEVIADLEREKVWDDPIVTELAPFSVFYPAEDYHQDYFNKNPNQPYCSAIVAPKVSKVRKAYFDRLVRA